MLDMLPFLPDAYREVLTIIVSILITIPAFGWFWLGIKEAKDLIKTVYSKIK